MKKVDPTNVLLSENFRLSDFLGCHSVYVYGHVNDATTLTRKHIKEGETLCQTLLEPLLAKFGPFSISYGYISPDLSRKIVRYQDPDRPSYHRWDAGAACDIVFHRQTYNNTPPILIAHEIDKHFAYSRLITYSESPFLCVATRAEEVLAKNPRRAFYENRYCGRRGVKPRWITKSSTAEGREREYAQLLSDGLEHDWQGAGYPTYHRGGQRQLQDRRTSKYSILTDFLYNQTAVAEGISNAPALTQKARRIFEAAGACYDRIIEGLGVPRLSVVDGYASPSLRAASDFVAAWAPDKFEFTIAVPPTKTAQDVFAVVGDAVVEEDKTLVTIRGCLDEA